MRLFVPLAAVVALAVAFTATAANAAPQRAKWTVMVYMSGDNNLEDYIVNDLELELGSAGFERGRAGGGARRSRAEDTTHGGATGRRRSSFMSRRAWWPTPRARSPIGANVTWAIRRPFVIS